MDKTEFDVFIKNNPISMVYLTAKWCAPCRNLKPRLYKLLESYPDAKILEIDVDEANIELIKELNVRVVPVLMFFKNGVFERRTFGNQTDAELIKFFNGEVSL